MKKFIVIYHASDDAVKQMASVSPEDQAKGMEGWMTWAQRCGNQLVDMGSPLMGGQALSPDGTSTNSNKSVTGYSILEAENMDDAKALLKGHPHISHGAECSIEVHETLPIPGM
ncbi:MAG: YciI family protein [Bacteroidetes bacterium]|nr:YciI family protein [Bacteroidota bacterium]